MVMSLRIIEWSDLVNNSISPGAGKAGRVTEASAMTIGVFDGVHL